MIDTKLRKLKKELKVFKSEKFLLLPETYPHTLLQKSPNQSDSEKNLKSIFNSTMSEKLAKETSKTCEIFKK